MIAKIWKKLLLAICIIACIYNVMYKLVNRIALKDQLESVSNQTSIWHVEDEKGEEEQKSIKKKDTIDEDEDVKTNKKVTNSSTSRIKKKKNTKQTEE